MKMIEVKDSLGNLLEIGDLISYSPNSSGTCRPGVYMGIEEISKGYKATFITLDPYSNYPGNYKLGKKLPGRKEIKTFYGNKIFIVKNVMKITKDYIPDKHYKILDLIRESSIKYKLNNVVL